MSPLRSLPEPKGAFWAYWDGTVMEQRGHNLVANVRAVQDAKMA
jgi:hypothetical protein